VGRECRGLVPARSGRSRGTALRWANGSAHYITELGAIQIDLPQMDGLTGATLREYRDQEAVVQADSS
jgi:hypothetical protein